MSKIEFLIVGTQKGGTTALWNYLRCHEQIIMPDCKEVHFFDNEIYFEPDPIPICAQYESCFPAYNALPGGGCVSIGNVPEKILYGECTPIYMYWEPAMRRIYEYNPEMKIIVILRNPIERAYSHWNMEKKRGADNSLCFEEAIKTESERSRWALPNQHRIYSYIDRGFYTEQIRRIWRYFPKPQVLILRNEDLRSNPNNVLVSVSDFLKIEPFKKIGVHENVEINSQYPDMSTADRIYLNHVFYHEIRQVEKMLGWKCMEWC